MFYGYFFSFFVSAIITFFLIPKIIHFGKKFNLLDTPDKRKRHKKSIVRIGGFAIFTGFLISTFLAKQLGWTEEQNNIFLITQISSICYFLIGFWDDLFIVSSFKRLIAQIIVAVFIWCQGIQINTIDLPFNLNNDLIYKIPTAISLLITVIWIVAVTNSFNWLDGLDGLSSGIAFIASLSFIFLFSSVTTNSSELFLIFSLAGACLGFLFFNFYPAKIFMGDGGSYFIGSNLALFSIYAHQFFIDNNINHLKFINPLLILFIPLADMSFVIFSRIYEGKSPFFPDRRHLHYKLIDFGVSHKKTVIIFYFLSILFSIISVFCLP